MDNLPLHPIVVHFPMALALLTPLLACWLLVRSWRVNSLRRDWTVVFVLCALMLISSFFAVRSGEDEEETVERVVAEELIEEHEEAAEIFAWSTGFLLMVGALPLILRDEKKRRIAACLFLVSSLIILGLGYRVGSAGGELVYQHGAAAAYTKGASNPSHTPHSPSHHDDDD